MAKRSRSDSRQSDSDDEFEQEDRELEKLMGEEADLNSAEDSQGSDSEEELTAGDRDVQEGSHSEKEDDSDVDSDISVDTLVMRDLEKIRLRSLSDNDESDEDVVYETGADGKLRAIRPVINPVYDSDDSDREDENTIGNVPISAYDEMPHIGYDIDGKRIMRPATASALDTLLETIDVPEGWTGLIDKNTGKGLNISQDELDLIRRLQFGENPDTSVNPFEDTVEWFSSQTEVMPLHGGQEPKRRFVPSKHEAKKVMKLVRAIREGKLVLNKKKPSEEDEFLEAYDVWADAEPVPDHIMNLRAPKLPPPTHALSYNPPEEYLDDSEDEKEKHEGEEDKETKIKSRKYDSLRKVPGYAEGVRERFERSLDLYLAPRVRKAKMDIDPESLIPDLPSPQDLRPFPIKCATIYRGHVGRVRCVGIDPTGQYVATGGDDGTVRVWELLTGKELWRCSVVKLDSYDDESGNEENDDVDDVKNHDNDKIEALEWHPSSETGILSVTAGDNIYLIVPSVFYIEKINAGRELIEAGWGYAQGGKATGSVDKLESGNSLEEEDDDEHDESVQTKKKVYARWAKPSKSQAEAGIGAIIRCAKTVKKVSWHRRGDYFVTVSPSANNSAVLVHQLSKHASQSPFRRARGLPQDAKFHPFRPHLYVASQRYVRVYDLSAQTMARKLMPGVKWVNSFDIHPRGDNVITSSYDKRVTWHDMDLSNKPYKTLKYHEKAVRDVKFHRSLPLFCSAADDGHINVFHGSVYDDLMKNPLLVPLKILKGHQIKNHLGVLALSWHPYEAWLLSAGADGTARLWVA